MSRVVVCLVALATIVIVAAGCNSGCTNCYTYTACAVPNTMQYSLVYPVPNSTGNPTSLSEVVIATSGTLPAQWNTGQGWDAELFYTATGTYPGTALGTEFATVNYSAVPTPNATPSFANPTYWVSTFSYAANANSPLPPGTTITATLNNLNSSCFPGKTVASFGT
jgi:hypothetical protein